MPIKNQFTTQSAAAFLGLHKNTLSNMRCNGTGPKYVKQGNKVFYLREHLMEYVKEQTKVICPKVKT